MRVAQWGAVRLRNISDAEVWMQSKEHGVVPHRFVQRRHPPQPFLSPAFLARRMPKRCRFS